VRDASSSTVVVGSVIKVQNLASDYDACIWIEEFCRMRFFEHLDTRLNLQGTQQRIRD